MLWKILHEWSPSRAIRNLGVLGTSGKSSLNRFTEQAVSAFAAPISLLTILHDHEIWVRASTGLDVMCLPRKDTFYHYAVDRGDLLKVCDALADPFSRTLLCVSGEPYARYYLGAPLTLARDMDVGVLCVRDTLPRPPASRDQCAYLAYLAGIPRQVAHAIERHAVIKGDPAA